MPSYTSLPGFRDFYPADLFVRQHIMETWRAVSQLYGFEEYDGPPLEPLDLYIEKSGEEIVDQLYSFEDKGGRAVALRPEMTPTFARMVGARASGMKKPIRWFSMPQLFRYERTQRGRLREHFQWNVDIVGEAAESADAEVLAVGLEALRRLGLGPDDVVARYSDRRLLEALLERLGVERTRLLSVYAAIDKLGREREETTRDRLRAAGLAAETVDRVLVLFHTQGLDALRAQHGRDTAVGPALDRLAGYGDALAALGFGDWIAFDLRIVRGLAYYTGPVFEIFDRRGELRALCGGGRYDALLRTVSASDLPACGFGMGDVVLTELLAELGRLPAYAPVIDFFIVAVTEAERALQLELAGRLRRAGRSVAYSFRAGGVRKQFGEADARGARHVVVLGPDEVAAGAAVVREMATGEERTVGLGEIGAPETPP